MERYGKIWRDMEIYREMLRYMERYLEIGGDIEMLRNVVRCSNAKRYIGMHRAAERYNEVHVYTDMEGHRETWRVHSRLLFKLL